MKPLSNVDQSEIPSGDVDVNEKLRSLSTVYNVAMDRIMNNLKDGRKEDYNDNVSRMFYRCRDAAVTFVIKKLTFNFNVV